MSEDSSNIPDRDTAQKLIEEFAEITKTNEALAQSFLQDHGWDLSKSIAAFYDALALENESEANKTKFDSGSLQSQNYNHPSKTSPLYDSKMGM